MIYERYADYDVLASNSLKALKGHGPGWCHPVFVNQTPLIYDLYTGGNEKNPQRDLGRLFGQFELHRKPNGVCEIWFIDKASSFDLERELTNEEKDLVGEFPLKGEKLDLYSQIKSRIRAEAEAEEDLLKEHFGKVIRVYFTRLAEWGIQLEKQFGVAKPEKLKRQQKRNIPIRPKRSEGEQWDRTWEIIAPKIDDDPTLGINDLLFFLDQMYGIKIGDDTLRKIIKWGRARKTQRKL